MGRIPKIVCGEPYNTLATPPLKLLSQELLIFNGGGILPALVRTAKLIG